MALLILMAGKGLLWLLPLLGASETTAGAVVASRVFRPVVLLLAAGGLVWGLWQGLPWLASRHDARVSDRATQQCVASHELQAEKERRKALETAVAQAQETLRQRELDLDFSRVAQAQLEKEKRDALEQTSDPDRIVVPADDPWLRRSQRRR